MYTRSAEAGRETLGSRLRILLPQIRKRKEDIWERAKEVFLKRQERFFSLISIFTVHI